jgi:hypothetical protein
MADYSVEDVFGIQRDIPLNYIAREDVDDIFIESLSRKRHIVIYGSSKQGKTCLRKKCLSEDQYIIIQCSNKFTIALLNEQILKQAGFQITTSEKKSLGNTFRVKATAGLKFFVKTEASGEYDRETTTEIEKKSFDIDLSDTNDIIKALKEINFSKFIILEDFHYLNKETQIDFAVALKMYFDNSTFVFIIVGVWLEENRLTVYNGDLAGRIVSLNADDWKEEDLTKVIEIGTSLLNVRFAEEWIDSIVDESFNNVCFVQEACYRLCKAVGIKGTVIIDPIKKTKRGYFDENDDYIDTSDEHDYRFYLHKDSANLKSIVTKITAEHSGRYKAFLIHFSDEICGTDHEICKWILYPLLNAEGDELGIGLPLDKIMQLITNKHPRGQELSIKDLIRVLKSCSDIQAKKNIKPNIIDYDETEEKLNVVDKGFIIWLEHQQKKNLLLSIGLPTD